MNVAMNAIVNAALNLITFACVCYLAVQSWRSRKANAAARDAMRKEAQKACQRFARRLETLNQTGKLTPIKTIWCANNELKTLLNGDLGREFDPADVEPQVSKETTA